MTETQANGPAANNREPLIVLNSNGLSVTENEIISKCQFAIRYKIIMRVWGGRRLWPLAPPRQRIPLTSQLMLGERKGGSMLHQMPRIKLIKIVASFSAIAMTLGRSCEMGQPSINELNFGINWRIKNSWKQQASLRLARQELSLPPQKPHTM